MLIWRISWFLGLFRYIMLLDKCFDSKNHYFLRLSISEHPYCFYLSLHMVILFPIVMYHHTTLPWTYNVNIPRNIMSGHARLVSYKEYILKIILIEYCATRTNIPITPSVYLHCIKNRCNNNQSVLILILMLDKTQYIAMIKMYFFPMNNIPNIARLMKSKVYIQ